MLRKFYLLVSLLSLTVSFANAQQLAGQELLIQLQQGGYVIFFRHAHSDWSQADREGASNIQIDGLTDREMLENCDIQRNLIDFGREEAVKLGEDFSTLAIPVGQVLSSPFCRCRDHAELQFGETHEIELTWDVFDSYSLSQGGTERNALRDALNARLSTIPADGTNTVIVAHQPNFNDATGIMLEEGEAAIVRPLGDSYEIVARIMSPDWLALQGTD